MDNLTEWFDSVERRLDALEDRATFAETREVLDVSAAQRDFEAPQERKSLAEAIHDADGAADSKWSDLTDFDKAVYRSMACAARESIESEVHQRDKTDRVNGQIRTAIIATRERAEKAEADLADEREGHDATITERDRLRDDLADMTRQRDALGRMADHNHDVAAKVKADRDEWCEDAIRNGEDRNKWMTKHAEMRRERDEWKARYKELREDVLNARRWVIVEGADLRVGDLAFIRTDVPDLLAEAARLRAGIVHARWVAEVNESDDTRTLHALLDDLADLLNPPTEE